MKSDNAHIGLCLNCQHARSIKGKERFYLLCERSFSDASFPRYPRLPVLRCAGYVEFAPRFAVKKKEAVVQPSRQLRILIADDHEIVRQGLRALLSRPGWTICAEAATGREAITMAEQHRPDIVVMDISMPELNGLEAIRRIRKILPKTEILILSLHHSDQLVRQAAQVGASGYVLKSDADKDLLKAVEALANHRIFFSSNLPVLDGTFNESTAVTEKENGLTSREREIVQLLAEGKSTKEVATMLAISTKTAETHRSNLMRKLEIHSVSELIRYAVRNRMIEP
jgi:DNA-binding NarL/FixJ family response regulator